MKNVLALDAAGWDVSSAVGWASEATNRSRATASFEISVAFSGLPLRRSVRVPVTRNWSVNTGAFERVGDHREHARHEVLKGVDRLPLADESYRETRLAAYRDAAVFLAALPPTIPDPMAFSAEDGEIVLEWRKPGERRAVVSFDGDGAYGYALLANGRIVAGTQDGIPGQSLQEDLSEYLLSFGVK